MDFKSIEDMTDNQINDLYDILSSENDLIAIDCDCVNGCGHCSGYLASYGGYRCATVYSGGRNFSKYVCFNDTCRDVCAAIGCLYGS